jgi:hypothetical protein
MKDKGKPIYIIDPVTLEFVPHYPKLAAERAERDRARHRPQHTTPTFDDVRLTARMYGGHEYLEETERKCCCCRCNEEDDDDFSMTANWYGD